MARLAQVFAPKDREFFDLFEEAAANAVQAADLIDRMLARYPESADLARDIVICEQTGDRITHDIIQRLNSTFVTPIDREDIHLLVSQLDNVVDLIDGTARRAAMFHITEVKEPAKRLCDVLLEATRSIESAVMNMRDSKQVVMRGREIKLKEEEGDALYHQAVGALFAGAPDPLEVIKWKELYDTLERALDQCEDVANVLESIALKHA
jgi:predicted phosphate transport protein (TIGR00153 family)